MFAELMALSWVLTRYYSCITIGIFICYFIKKKNVTRGLKMHKSRRVVKVPRRKVARRTRPPH